MSSVDESLFRFREDDLVRRLPEASLLKIGILVGSDLPENWIILATKLGLSNEEIDRIRPLPNPGYEVLRVWQRRNWTTIRVLRNVLTTMKRYDVLEKLDKARQDPVDLTLVIRFQSEFKSEALNGVPFQKVLLDCVRPLIHRSFWSDLLRGMFKARLSLSHGSRQCWTSFVGEFRGQQIEVELVKISENTGRGITEYSSRRIHVETVRSCQSYLQDETLFFEHFQEKPEDDAESGSESSIKFENSEERLSPAVSSPAALAGNAEKITSIVGFHPEIPMDESRRTKTAEILQPHLNVDGSYILRPPTIANSSVTLSAVFGREIFHYSIMKKVVDGNKVVYSIYEKDRAFEGVAELIDYYKTHGLSLPNSSVDMLYLTKPVL